MATAAAVADTTTPFQFLRVTSIVPSPLNPRKHFDQAKLQELAATMGNGVGVIEPLVVRPIDVMRAIGVSPERAARNQADYELVAGERRWRAAQIAGLVEVPCLIRELTDAQVLEIMVIENDQREDINPLEEGDGFRRLMTFGFDIDKLASRIGRSRKYIYDRVKLLDLVPAAQQLLLQERITAGHAILLARLTPEQQAEALNPDNDAVFCYEDALDFDDTPIHQRRKTDPYAGRKTTSVRELEAWISHNIRLDVTATETRELFPEAAAAAEQPEQVVHISYGWSHDVKRATTGDGPRVHARDEWKRADGAEKSKACKSAVTGIVVLGHGRGKAFKVCIDRTQCRTHWADEIKRKAEEAKARAAGSSGSSSGKSAADRAKAERNKWRRQQEERERKQKLWEKAAPKILEAVGAKVRSCPIATVINELIAAQRPPDVKAAVDLLGLDPKTKRGPEEALRVLLLIALCDSAGYYNSTNFSKDVKKLFGVDTAAIVKAVQTSAPEPPAPAKKKAAKKR